MLEDIYLTEVFSAIQGEGYYVGYRQIFVRLTGCNIRCDYCDQPESLQLSKGSCRIEKTCGSRDWRVEQSPYPIESLVRDVVTLDSALPHHSISITGGEPLMQSQRLPVLLSRLKDHSLRIHLETNGMLGSSLAKSVSYLDAISMDIKLSSVDNQKIALDDHLNFIEIALSRSDTVHLYAKIVVGSRTSLPELNQAIEALSRYDRVRDIFLQPVTIFGSVKETCSPEQLLHLHEEALRVNKNIRVVPQTHKLINQL